MSLRQMGRGDLRRSCRLVTRRRKTTIAYIRAPIVRSKVETCLELRHRPRHPSQLWYLHLALCHIEHHLGITVPLVAYKQSKTKFHRQHRPDLTSLIRSEWRPRLQKLNSLKHNLLQDQRQEPHLRDVHKSLAPLHLLAAMTIIMRFVGLCRAQFPLYKAQPLPGLVLHNGRLLRSSSHRPPLLLPRSQPE